MWPILDLGSMNFPDMSLFFIRTLQPRQDEAVRTRQVSKKARERKVAGTLEDEPEFSSLASTDDGECDVFYALPTAAAVVESHICEP